LTDFRRDIVSNCVIHIPLNTSITCTATCITEMLKIFKFSSLFVIKEYAQNYACGVGKKNNLKEALLSDQILHIISVCKNTFSEYIKFARYNFNFHIVSHFVILDT